MMAPLPEAGRLFGRTFRRRQVGDRIGRMPSGFGIFRSTPIFPRGNTGPFSPSRFLMPPHRRPMLTSTSREPLTAAPDRHSRRSAMTFVRRALRIAAIAPMLFGAALLGQTPSPDTPAARQLRRWMETLNAGDRAERSRFLKENFPARSNPENVDQDLAFLDQTGGVELVKLEESSATRAVALLKPRDSETSSIKITIEVDSAVPYRITNLNFQPGGRLAVTIPRLSDSELANAVKAEAERRAAADRFAGAVLVGKNGKAIFSGAYGLADRTDAVANKLDTRFRNGSMNKMFTAVAILTLVQAGNVSLDAPLGTYLTDYPNKSVASKVTVHHLLTHTGGTGDIFGPQFTAHRLELKTHQDYLNLYGKRELAFEPGSRWAYSNYGYVLLGAIIEKVSGKSYYDYVRDHVYRPAGMTSTGSEPEDEKVDRRATGYTKASGTRTWAPNAETLPYRGTAAGGGYTTVEDLFRFANALTSHKLLDARHTELLTTGKVDAFGAKYAYGFIDRTADGVRSVGHGGGAPGMNGDLVIFPGSGYVVAVLANLDPPAAQRISEFAANRVPAKGQQP